VTRSRKPRAAWGASPTAVPTTDSGEIDEQPHDPVDQRRPSFREWFDPSPSTATTVPGEPAPPVVTDAPLPPYVQVVSPGVGTAPRLVAVLMAGVLVALVLVWTATRLI
jgi:hypothetical protein